MKYMDLLFKRYASPFILLEETIRCGRFSEFISEFLKMHNEDVDNETLWEWYLHHPFLNKTFGEFKNLLGIEENEPAQKIDFATVVNDSMSILEGFVPEE